MKKSILLLVLTLAALSSCKENSKSTPDTVDTKTLDSVKNIENKKQAALNKAIYTKYKYRDSKGASLIIENSLPKGGSRYTDPNGKEYIYVLFWTRINNQTADPLELKMAFPIDSYEIPALPDQYFKILLPPNEMTYEKIPLFNYGFKDLNSFLDKNIHKSSSLKRTINPKQSSSFYVVLLCVTKGAHGTLRTGLSLKGQNLFYTINDREIHCGSINLEDLTLQK
ncbi:hypothetical protein [Flavobacterium sp. FlaQc-30]|uniref:hypothetical protein n=1 Tax=Flavobacterium sp. FlaQc-30 TaxID=3374179 RepID=UPI0037574BBE